MHNEQKTVVAKKFARTLKNKISKNMTTISKNLSPNELPELARQYINTIPKPIKIKRADPKSDTYINFGLEFSRKTWIWDWLLCTNPNM